VTRILVVTALAIEADSLARRLRLPPVRPSGCLRARGPRVDVACVGLRAERLAAVDSDAELVVSAGACGALAPGLVRGALVAPEVVLTASGEARATDPAPGVERSGRLVTVGELADTADGKARLRRATGADAVDMESALIVAWAHASGRRATVVRAVSDDAGTAIPRALAALVEPHGRLRPARALVTLVGRPAVLPAALALRAGTAAALATVAAALSRMLASSEPCPTR
jgi:hypothetical protein